MSKLTNKYTSPAYWTQLIQLMLYRNIKAYLEEHNMTQKEFAAHLGVSKGYVSQILSGDFDHKLSKLTELALACDLVPRLEFVPAEFAAQVAKSCYIQPTDWKMCDSYSNVVLFGLPKVTPDTSFAKASNTVILNIPLNGQVWQSQESHSSTKIA